MATEPHAYVDLTFSPNVDLVSVVRRFVLHFCRQTFDDEALTSRIGVATHELLENAVRYADAGDSRVRIEVSGSDGHQHIRIRTWNKATPAQVAVVERMIADMASAADPASYYSTLMRTSTRSVGSGLGLGRVFAESEMNLTCATDGGGLMIQAESRRPGVAE